VGEVASNPVFLLGPDVIGGEFQAAAIEGGGPALLNERRKSIQDGEIGRHGPIRRNP
jgi:hypothetical protein